MSEPHLFIKFLQWKDKWTPRGSFKVAEGRRAFPGCATASTTQTSEPDNASTLGHSINDPQIWPRPALSRFPLSNSISFFPLTIKNFLNQYPFLKYDVFHLDPRTSLYYGRILVNQVAFHTLDIRKYKIFKIILSSCFRFQIQNYSHNFRPNSYKYLFLPISFHANKSFVFVFV